MQRLSLLAFTLLLMGAGCASTNTVLESESPLTAETLFADFEPTVGAGTAPDGLGEDKNGPWDRRMMIATSEDGLNWTRTGQIVADQANVPDMLMDDNGWLWLYYNGWEVGQQLNTQGVAISTDHGETWIHKYVEFDGFRMAPVDPSVLYEDGVFKMWAATLEDGSDHISIFYAESTDGIHFENKGEVFDPDAEANVPSVVNIDGTYHLFAATNYTNDNWITTSKNETDFEVKSYEPFLIGHAPQKFSNGLAVDGGYRVYLYDPMAGTINSMFSTDGEQWEAESGTRLKVDSTSRAESDFVKDPAVIRLGDGSYLMVYVTVIP